MFIRFKSTPNSPRKSVQIVSSRRVNGQVKQYIVRHVGVAMDDGELAQLEKLAEEIREKLETQAKQASEAAQGPLLFDEKDLSGGVSAEISSFAKRARGRPKHKRLEDVLPVDQVTLADIKEECRVIEGFDEIVSPLYDDLGFNEILPGKMGKTLKEIALMRLVTPSSKLAACANVKRWMDRPLPVDRVYRMMDRLEEVIPSLKKTVRLSSLRLYDEAIEIALFDVTTLYFESTQEDELRAFGYSKDQKYHCVQVVLALATTVDGLPVGYELFEGNRAETQTLLSCLNAWKEQGLNIKNVCLVADRALFSHNNLAALDEAGWKYVVATPMKKLSTKVKSEILSEGGYRLGTLTGAEPAWVKELDLEGRRLIVSYSAKRHAKDAKDRERLLKKLQEKLGTKSDMKKLISNKGYLKFTKTGQETSCTIDEHKIEQDALWDGLHGVVTNDKGIDRLAALAKYRRLWVIEESFRINKHTLQMRPIYHFKPERIKAHIALCYLSFALLRQLELRVKLAQCQMSPQQILDALMETQASIYVHKRTQDRYRIPGAMSVRARKVYRAFGVCRQMDATPQLT